MSSLLAGVTALDLRYFWTEHATALYMLHAAVYCLYIIFCLYRSEFFCFSLAAVFAGFSFYFYSKGLGMNARTAIIAIVTALVLGSALFAYYCMFAAIAIELTGAVYYTFQLK